jgi:N-terminal acetyltransferase B complex catalytic subunit
MSTTRRFKCEDLFKFNNINLDVLTETVLFSPYFLFTTLLRLSIAVQHAILPPVPSEMAGVLHRAASAKRSAHGIQ